MRRTGHGTAFYLETLLLVLVMLGIILILTQVFGLGRVQSAGAAHLSDAVTLAQNAAEAVAAAEDAAALPALLVQDPGLREKAVTAGDCLTVSYGRGLRPEPAGPYQVRIGWSEEADGLVRSRIEVFYATQPEALYTLDTAVYHGEVGA